jgi:ubiquitin-conjugating enzyme E2 S
MSLSIASIKRVVAEVQDLMANPPEDIRIQLNEDDITDISAFIRGPEGTPFEGGVFKIKLNLETEFPAVPPKGYFVTKIFHPNVSLKGEICVNTLKKDWKPELGIRHVLLTVKCLLINPNPESALNEEAGKLLLEKYEDYCKRAALMTSVHGKKIKWEEVSEAGEAAEGGATTEKPEEESKENDAAATNAEVKPLATTAPAAKKKPAAAPVPAAASTKAKKSLKRL